METPVHHLYRKDGPDTSEAAAHSIDVTTLEGMVLDAIRKAGKDGIISDEVRKSFPDLSYSSVTARYAALERKRLIEYTGEKRPGASGRGQRIMRATS